MLRALLRPLAFSLCFSLAAGSMAPAAQGAQLPVGAPAPDFKIEQWYNYDGAGSLHELRGRVVLLKFWRSW